MTHESGKPKRGKRYPAHSFLRRFPDVKVREAIISASPNVDFSEGSRDLFDPSIVTHLDVYTIRHPRSVDALGVFTNLQVFEAHCKMPSLTIPASWTRIERIELAGDVQRIAFPERMPAIRKIVLDYMGCEEGLILPKEAPLLEHLDCWNSDTPDTEYDVSGMPALRIMRGTRGRCVNPPEMLPGIAMFEHGISDAPLTPYDLNHLSPQELCEAEFDRPWTLRFHQSCLRGVLKIAHRPNVRELVLDDLYQNCDELESVYLHDLPALYEVRIERLPKLSSIRFPEWDDGVSDGVSPKRLDPLDEDAPRAVYISVKQCPSLKRFAFTRDQYYSGIQMESCALEQIELPDVLPSHLSLDDNLLTELPLPAGASGTPLDQPMLKSLSLDENPISRLPAFSAPALEYLNLSYTGIPSWRGAPVSHPEQLRSFSAYLDDPADLDEIEARFPNLLEFNPWIDRDMDLTGLFGRWDARFHYDDEYRGDRQHSRKIIRASGARRMILIGTPEDSELGHVEVRLLDLPAVRHFVEAGCTIEWEEQSDIEYDPAQYALTLTHFYRRDSEWNAVFKRIQLQFKIHNPSRTDAIQYHSWVYPFFIFDKHPFPALEEDDVTLTRDGNLLFMCYQLRGMPGRGRVSIGDAVYPVQEKLEWAGYGCMTLQLSDEDRLALRAGASIRFVGLYDSDWAPMPDVEFRLGEDDIP